MRHFYLHASAWTKRFTNESGGETVSPGHGRLGQVRGHHPGGI